MIYSCGSCGARRFRWNDEGRPVCAVCNAVQQSYETTGIDVFDSGVHFTRQSLIDRARVAQRKQRKEAPELASPRRRARLWDRRRLGVAIAADLQSPDTTELMNLSIVFGAIGEAIAYLVGQTAGSVALRYVSHWIHALLTSRFARHHQYVTRAFANGSGAVKLRIGASTLTAAVFLGIVEARAETSDPSLNAYHSLCFLDQLQRGLMSRLRELLLPYIHCKDHEYRTHRPRLVARAHQLVAKLGDERTLVSWDIAPEDIRSGSAPERRLAIDIPIEQPEALVRWLRDRWAARCSECSPQSSATTGAATEACIQRQVRDWSPRTELEAALDTVLATALHVDAGLIELAENVPTGIHAPAPTGEVADDIASVQQSVSDGWFADSLPHLNQHDDKVWREIVLCVRRLPPATRMQPRVRAVLKAVDRQRLTTALWGSCPWRITAQGRGLSEMRQRASCPPEQSFAEHVSRVFGLSPSRFERCLRRRASELGLKFRVHSSESTEADSGICQS